VSPGVTAGFWGWGKEPALEPKKTPRFRGCLSKKKNNKKKNTRNGKSEYVRGGVTGQGCATGPVSKGQATKGGSKKTHPS